MNISVHHLDDVSTEDSGAIPFQIAQTNLMSLIVVWILFTFSAGNCMKFFDQNFVHFNI